MRSARARLLSTGILVALGCGERGKVGGPAAPKPTTGFVSNQRIVYTDGLHNENTDLAYFQGRLYLVFRGGETGQQGTAEARLKIFESADRGDTFRQVSEIFMPNRDIRDPKLLVRGGKLVVLAISRVPGVYPRDDGSLAWAVRTESADGRSWPTPTRVHDETWGLWRYAERGQTLYATGYNDGDVKVGFFESKDDGRSWKQLGLIYDSIDDVPSEAELRFFGDRAVSLVRLDNRGILASGQTAICTADPPYSSWACDRRFDLRFDGPAWFEHAGRQIVVARKHLADTRKRTAVYELVGDLANPTSPIDVLELSELQSSGDTAYSAVVPIAPGQYLVSWYSNDVTTDLPWLTGIFSPSDIWVAWLDFGKLPTPAGTLAGSTRNPAGPTTTWPAALAVVPTGGRMVGGTQHFSSTRLSASFSAAPGPVDHYELQAASVGAMPVAGRAMGTSHVLKGLRAGTRYDVSLRACNDAACTSFLTADAPARATTPAEAWQLQGTGADLAGLARPVSDGNVRIHAFAYGPDAPASLAGRVQLYYGPMSMTARGLTVATAARPAVTGDGASVGAFTSHAGSAGLITPAAAGPLVGEINAGQAVPVSAALGGHVRLYFETQGADGRSRILYIPSADGYSGLDFNAGAQTVCSAAADYTPGGGCAPTVAIGVEGDAISGNAGIRNARQFKIGLPLQDDWRWSGAAGTFMLFTTDTIPGCSTGVRNHAYAVWDGAAWQVQYARPGCPRLFANAQAMTPVHLGGVRYKAYFGDPSVMTGMRPGSRLPWLGPKKLLHADGARTGEADRVDFEDWEPTQQARDVTFLWPSGAPLDDAAEGYIDDFVALAPTRDLDFQVLYLAITDGVQIPFSAVALLVNP